MATPTSIPPGETRATSRAECASLLVEATPGLFRKNAFRLLGLPVDASAREISKQGVKIKQMQELGLGTGSLAPAYPTAPPPTLDELRAAIQRLADPEKRLVDEFFWFWPEDFAHGRQDAALLALLAGDTDTAVRLWTLRESDPASGLVATHNLAVVWHMTALEFENQANGVSRSPDGLRRGEQFWGEALPRWERLAGEEKFWDQFHLRLRQINDGRLNSGFAHRFRNSLPEAVAGINGQLALQSEEAGAPAVAARHARLLRETNRGLVDLERVAQRVLAPLSERLKEHVQRAQRAAAEQPPTAAAAQALAVEAVRTMAVFDLIGGANSKFRRDLFDEIALACNQMVIQYDNKTQDEKNGLAVLQIALPLASFDTLRKQIEVNITILTARLAARRQAARQATARPTPPSAASAAKPPPIPPGPAPRRAPETAESATTKKAVARVLEKYFLVASSGQVVKQLKALQNRRESAHEKISLFYRLWQAKLENAVAELPADDDAAWELCAGVVALLQAISRQAMRENGDVPTATRANELAFKFAKDPALWNSLKEDRLGFVTPAKTNKLLRDLGLVAVGLLLGSLVLFGSCAHEPQSWNTSPPH